MRFGPEILGDLDLAECREWLVTNGIGGYGSGTVAGSLSRGYHGLLVAAVHPPTDRRLVLAKLQERVTCGSTALDLTTDRWASGVIDSGRFILGPEVEAFERELAALLGVRHVVGVANGTDAITLALRALGVGPGDEVFVVPPPAGAF